MGAPILVALRLESNRPTSPTLDTEKHTPPRFPSVSSSAISRGWKAETDITSLAGSENWLRRRSASGIPSQHRQPSRRISKTETVNSCRRRRLAPGPRGERASRAAAHCSIHDSAVRRPGSLTIPSPPAASEWANADATSAGLRSLVQHVGGHDQIERAQVVGKFAPIDQPRVERVDRVKLGVGRRELQRVGIVVGGQHLEPGAGRGQAHQTDAAAELKTRSRLPRQTGNSFGKHAGALGQQSAQ